MVKFWMSVKTKLKEIDVNLNVCVQKCEIFKYDHQFLCKSTGRRERVVDVYVSICPYNEILH